MGWILYDPVDLADPSIAVPLGLPRRIVFLCVGFGLGLTGLLSTVLFQILSKTNNDLRQRGRYLVAGQGYLSTVMTTVVFVYQGFMFRFPCFVLFWGVYICFVGFMLLFMARAWRLVTRYDRSRAIYEAPFTVPADEEDTALDIQQTISQSATSGTVNSLSDSTTSTNTVVNDSGDNTRAKVSSEQGPEDAALAKKWYKRYWNVTDRRALWFFLLIFFANFVCGVVYQILSQLHGGNLSIYNPTSFNCHNSYEYHPPQLIAVVFVFIFSPALIYRLRNFNDGFGIRNDLLAVSMMGIPGIVLFVVVPIYAPEFSDKYLDRTTWMALILILSHIFAVTIPLVRYVANSSYRCAFEAAYASVKENKKAKRLQRAAFASSSLEGDKAGSSAGTAVYVARQQSRAPTIRRMHDIALETMHAPRAESSDGGEGVGGVHKNNHNSSHLNVPEMSDIAAQRRPSRAGLSTNFLFWSKPQDGDLRYDWDAFVMALNDPEVFDKISAFTVGEFCAENTRFLAELSRLEKRAQRYERLRSLTVAGKGGDSGTGTCLINATSSSAAPRLRRSPGTQEEGTQSREPYRFPPSDIEMGSTDRIHVYDPNNGGSKHRIKKIVSVSSVSSSMPMLSASGKGRSSLSLDDFSEPPSPLGAPPVIRSPAVLGGGGGFRSNQMLDALRTSPPLQEKTETLLVEETLVDDSAFIPPETINTTATIITSGAAPNDDTSAPESPQDNRRVPLPETPMAMAPLPMPPTLLIQFQNMYKTFIRHGGRLELNLSHDTYLEITGMAKRGEWRADMFESAKIEVYELLFRDVWSKFVSASHSWLSARAREGASA